jgi:hypothetical protein
MRGGRAGARTVLHPQGSADVEPLFCTDGSADSPSPPSTSRTASPLAPRSPRPGPLPEPVPLLLCHCLELLQPACPGVAELQRCSHLFFCPYPYVLFVYLVDEISIFLVTITIFHGCLIVHFGVHHERLVQFYLESLSLMYCTISVILVLYFVVLFMLL